MKIQTDCDESSDVDYFDVTNKRMDANWLASGSISYDSSNLFNPFDSFAEKYLLMCATFQIFNTWISVKDVVSLDAALKKGKKVLISCIFHIIPLIFFKKCQLFNNSSVFIRFVFNFCEHRHLSTH